MTTTTPAPLDMTEVVVAAQQHMAELGLTKPGDLALCIRTALADAGYKIVVMPQAERVRRAEQQAKDAAEASFIAGERARYNSR